MTAGFTQPGFAAALVDRALPVPAGIHGGDPGGRFFIHRRNVHGGLTRALEERFPVVRRLVGGAFFAGLADAFIVRHPPRSPVLLRYGDAMPGFVAGFAPARSEPYLSDIASLEVARGRAYHAADVASLSPAAFAAFRAADLSGLRFRLHPSVAILRSQYPIVAIWARNAEGDGDMADLAWRAEDAAVVRRGLEVATEPLDLGEAVFLESLGRHETLGEALSAAMADDATFNFGKALTRLIGQGLAGSLFPSLEIPEDMA